MGVPNAPTWNNFAMLSGKYDRKAMSPFAKLLWPLLNNYSATTVIQHSLPVSVLDVTSEKIQTVAGPMIDTPLSADILMSFRVRFSGMPSAMIAIVRIYKSYHQQYSRYQLTSNLRTELFR